MNSVQLKTHAEEIINGRVAEHRSYSLEEFKELYRYIERFNDELNRPSFETYILLLSDKAIIRFSVNPGALLQVKSRGMLYRKDFEIVINPTFEGNINPIPLRSFLWTEITGNGLILLAVFLLIFWLLRADTDFSSVQVIDQMLVEANALFIGIFVLFTASQNRELLSSKELIKRGLTHQLMQNDKHIINLAISSLLLAFFSVALIEWVYLKEYVNILGFQILLIPFLPQIITGISLVLLVDCFLAVTKYYLRVMQTAIESLFVRDLLRSDHNQANRSDKSSSPQNSTDTPTQNGEKPRI